MGESKKTRLPRPATLIACGALLVALAGTAVAVNEGKIETKDVDLIKYEKKAGVQATVTTSTIMSGPKMKLKVKPGDLLRVMARVDLQRTMGTSSCDVRLGVNTEGGGVYNDILTTTSASFETRYLDAGPVGSTDQTDAVERTVPITEKDELTVEIAYRSGGPTTACNFQDRHLWVEQIR